jgi:ribonuclease P protein component
LADAAGKMTEGGAKNLNVSYCFPKGERLKRREDVRVVLKTGILVSCPGARLFFLRKGGTERRIAFTFSRKFGSAVERNRARRLGRESYRHLRGSIKTGYDLVLLVYPSENGYAENALSFRMTQMRTLLGRAGLFAARDSR